MRSKIPSSPDDTASATGPFVTGTVDDSFNVSPPGTMVIDSVTSVVVAIFSIVEDEVVATTIGDVVVAILISAGSADSTSVSSSVITCPKAGDAIKNSDRNNTRFICL